MFLKSLFFLFVSCIITCTSNFIEIPLQSTSIGPSYPQYHSSVHRKNQEPHSAIRNGEEDQILILSSAHASPNPSHLPGQVVNSSDLSYEIRLKSALSVSLPSTANPNQNLPRVKAIDEDSLVTKDVTSVTSPSVDNVTSEIVTAPPDVTSFENITHLPSTLLVKNDRKAKHNPRGLITAIALILANSLASSEMSKAFYNESNHFSQNGTKAQMDDLMTSESNIISSSATNVANWFRNIISGNKWKKNRDVDKTYYSSQILPQYSHNYITKGVPPPSDQFIQSILPAPEGFPSPYSGNSVLLPPEALQDTGIMYWLNFIEQAAHQSHHDGPDQGEEHMRPLKIGEKPPRSGPNSIRDELIMDEGEENEGDPYERSRRVRPNQSMPAGRPMHGNQEDNPATEALHSDASAPRCDKFTSTICVDDFEYPEQAIVDEIYKRREIFELMYSDDAPKSNSQSLVDGIPRDVEESYVYESYDNKDSSEAASSVSSSKESTTGYVCPSEVLYGKPKLAKSISGEWKVIVNAGEFTQTLRMEKCLKPNSRCNYILPHLETRCAQVNSVHRLMVFEKGRGFFVESFKIPTGCNCQIVRSSLKANVHTTSASASTEQQVTGDTGNSQLQNSQAMSPISGSTYSVPTSNLASILSSNRNRYKNHQTSYPQQLAQQVQMQHFLNLLQQQNQGNSALQSQMQTSVRRPNQTQLSNTLWSLLMGGDPSGGSATVEDSLLHHLHQRYPQATGQGNPEAVLEQLIGDQHYHHRNVVNKSGGYKGANIQQNKILAQGGNPHVLPSTTTIVSPSGTNGGQPLVQVIHVPVTSGAYHPHSLFKSQGNGPVLAAYDSNSSGTIYTQENNETTKHVNSSRLETFPESLDGDIHPRNGTSASSLSFHSTVNRPTDDDNDGDMDDDKDELILSPSQSPLGMKQEAQESHFNQSVDRPRGNSDQVNSAISASNNSVTKRILSQKMNFNYHPILDYIPVSSSP